MKALTGQRIFNDTFGKEGRQWSSLSIHERAYYEGLAEEYKAATKKELEPSTIATVTKALSNVGINVECGACMETAFTGVSLAAHDCTKLPMPLVFSKEDTTKSCGTCANRCMDMDMDPYCVAVNKPFGQTLGRGRPSECSNFELWEKDTRQAYGG